MNPTQMTERGGGTGEQEREVGLFDLLIVLAKHKKWIAGLPVVVAIVAAGVSLMLPNIYKATARLLPPQQSQSGASALLSQLGGIAGVAGAGGGLKNPNDLYVGMLKSRTVADRLVGKFDLKKVYGTTSEEMAREALEGSTAITAGKDGLITIEVEGKDQQLVAKMANAYVDELMRLTRSLAVTEASQRRLFFERQLEQSKDNLAKAEMALKGTLDTQGVISVDNESAGLMATVARVRAQISAKEIEINSMSAFVTPNHPEYRHATEELASLRRELSRLENGSPKEPAAAGNVPAQSGIRNVAMLRDVKYYQMLYELLAKQYEVARLDEAKEPSIVQVLDAAVTPEHKSKPKRSVIVLVSALLGFVAAVLGAIIFEAKQRTMRTAAGAARWYELKCHLRVNKSVR